MNLCEYTLQEYYSKCNSPEANCVAYYYFRVYKRETILSFMRRALTTIPSETGVRVLDLGCGDASDVDFSICRLSEYWQNMNAVNPITWCGIDGNLIHVELARERFDSLCLRNEFVHGAITERLPWDDLSFDLIVCSEVVEHLQQPMDVFRECFRTLKPGGHLILTTDNEPTAWARMKRTLSKVAGRYRKSESELWRSEGKCSPVFTATVAGRNVPIYGHIHTVTTQAWERMCQEAGFKIASYGQYRSAIRRQSSNSPFHLFALFSANYLISLLPPRIGRYFDATTALLLRKP